MAALPLMRAIGLGKAFADFAALPGLLRLQAREHPGVQGWARLLEEQGFNEDHLEQEDTPRMRQDLTAFVAKDAMRFCRRLQLLEKDGTLTAAGRRIAELASEVRRLHRGRGAVSPGHRMSS